jgi:NAD(P)H dehydrogenase (quinone)
VAAILFDPAHAGQVYDVSGPHAIDLDQTAAELAEVTGRQISYEPETADQARASRSGHDAEDWMIDGWVGSYLAVATGETSVTSHTVEHVTGVAPMSLGEFLRAEPESWAPLRRN